MEKKRQLKVTFGKSGSGSLNPRISLPKSFLDVLEVTQDQRDVIMELDEEKKTITIKKKQ